MKTHKTSQPFVICVRNKGAEDLTIRKIYQVVPDEKATKSGCLRIIDESGEDYLYPEDYFVAITLPKKVEEALASA